MLSQTVLLALAFVLLASTGSAKGFAVGPQQPQKCRQSSQRRQTNTSTLLAMSGSPLNNNDNNQESENINRKTWNPLRLMVLKLGFTEPAWTSPWNYQKPETGVFSCAYCGNPLFDADSKYDSGSGWPSFWRSTSEGSVGLKREWDGRLECTCGRCGAHLGHVFPDGPSPKSMPTNKVGTIPSSDPDVTRNRLPRFCVNGASIRYDDSEE